MTTRGNIRQQNAERRLSHAAWEQQRGAYGGPVGIAIMLAVACMLGVLIVGIP